jgi:hypothetical protein
VIRRQKGKKRRMHGLGLREEVERVMRYQQFLDRTAKERVGQMVRLSVPTSKEDR